MNKKEKRNTKRQIIKVGCELFVKKGFYNTTLAMIAKEIGISVGNLNFHFPTKEDLLMVLTQELCDFQWKLMEYEAKEGLSSLLAICLELATMASACEQNETVKDFFLASYNHSKTLEIIRNKDYQRNKEIFKQYCMDWDEQDFVDAENIVSGIEFATFMTTNSSAPLNSRIKSALTAIMKLYNVPKEIIDVKISKVLSMDYISIGNRILNEFINYLHEVNNDF